ncbi:MAG: hypothetical protein AAF664_08935 [Planctomycetota bacterium]
MNTKLLNLSRKSSRLSAIVPVFIAILIIIDATTAVGQTVQLPSFRSFNYSGTVEVPDGGSAFLGGNSSGIIRQSSKSNSTATIGGVSGLYTGASIIDLDAMDRQILGNPPIVRVRNGAQNRLGGPKNEEQVRQGKRWVRIARKDLENGRIEAAAGAYRNSLRYLDSRLADLARSEYRRNIPAAFRSGAR